MNDEDKIFQLYMENAAAKQQPTLYEYENGDKIWRLGGHPHREDGPAYEREDGTKMWYLRGKMHRADGPAAVHSHGTKEWRWHGKLHRADGPAVEYPNGMKEWFLDDKYYATSEAWAEALLKQRNKPHDAAAIDAFLKTILKKDVDEAL